MRVLLGQICSMLDADRTFGCFPLDCQYTGLAG